MEGIESFAVGHFAIGYILSKATAQVTKTRINIPLVLTLSVVPDIDILLIPFLRDPYIHRGPTHSIIIAFLVFIPIFIIHHKSALPYFVALVQHSLIGDYVAGGEGGTQLLWPLTLNHYGMKIGIESPINITLEWTTFLISAILILKTRDIDMLLKPHNSNLILIVPTFTVLLPTLLAYPINVPLALIPPHIICLILFTASLLIDIRKS
jgi:membrane-bound metal-dependent hydrolase YbcI (DUF457 family)